MNISEAFENCLNDLDDRPNTQRAYRAGLAKFSEYLEGAHVLPDADVTKLTPVLFNRFLSWIARQGPPRNTLSTYAAAQKYFMDWLTMQKLMDVSYSDVLNYKTAKKRAFKSGGERLPRKVEQIDVEAIREMANMLPYPSPIKERNIALVEFLASSGCRNAEAAGLTIERVNLTDRTALVDGKTGEGKVYFSAETADAFDKYWAARGFRSPRDAAFSGHGNRNQRGKLSGTAIRKIVHEIAGAAGVKIFTPHYFRHAFASRILRETGNLALTQDLLRHKSPTSTRVYAKIDDSELKDAHERIFK
jgi:site-specific recombinase XerD